MKFRHTKLITPQFSGMKPSFSEQHILCTLFTCYALNTGCFRNELCEKSLTYQLGAIPMTQVLGPVLRNVKIFV